MSQLFLLQVVLVRVGVPQFSYDYFGGRGLKRLRTTDIDNWSKSDFVLDSYAQA